MQVCTRVETKTVFLIFAKNENEQVFPNFRESSFRENFRFRKSFREKFSFSRKSFVLTSIIVHVYGYCLICFETLPGFDRPVGYHYNKTAVSFVLKQDSDLLVLITQ
jgi:hypothetical protein